VTLEALDTGQGYLKAGFLGFPKSGKTYTATLLAAEVRRRFGMSAPLAYFDTEGGAAYVAELAKKLCGAAPVGRRSRAFVDLLEVARECESGTASVLVVDSITHVWREVCDAYLAQVNRARDASGKPARTRLEFQDWNHIKRRWSEWTDFYLNSKLHIIICGRAGFEWNFEEHENADGTVHKELVKTGVKMKVESEFGFEPSLLVEMERPQVPDPERPGRFRIVHRATVLGDRFGVLDGKSTENPDGAWFGPHLDMLRPGAHNAVDTKSETPMGVDESGDADWQRERRERTILCEEIQGEIVSALPGQSAKEKKAKTDLLESTFGTRSWTAVEKMDSHQLAAGLAALREKLATTAKGDD